MSALHHKQIPYFAFVLLALFAISATTHAKDSLQLERVILLYRHGVRTPLPGEIQLDDVTDKPWPSWAQPPSELTPHGAAGVRLMGQYDRHRLAAAGLFPTHGCPDPTQLWFWANTDQRTIASAQALAEGFAPGCNIDIGHLPQGSEDPLFHPIEAGATDWNAQHAVASIQASTGGPDTLTAPHRDALATIAKVMGCGSRHDPEWCATDQWRGGLIVSPDRQHMLLTGPIAKTSGTAEVILMAYAEGRAMRDVGWGRVTPEQLEQLSQLHALLFDIYARPDYMAERVASVMSQKIVHLLQDERAPRLSVLVGSDNNIVALASMLGLHFKMPGYANDDPPIGGAFGIELWQNTTSGHRYVRVFYQAQSLAQLRSLQPASALAQPATLILEPPGCQPDDKGRCPIEVLLSRLHR
ncbi:histidine-type phosphatase [Dyella nitratireducens]|uniref:Phosphoanhydride phosphohydrolase n=1 Tax=Dyella nitratireducens TaxID=1849580 RepID=A0ABQ1FIT7_9GAMM|nr:histidine-type phosphatase [Dyella nitratireducens]GGA16831.1 phosphoanhydride phosphohydrolase [Dyella nitratireducens]GLQ44871.1 phosphoanhydride phosphohydrolase [Dyella nitratireducens]